MEIPWVIEEQTKIKHEILQSYIETWATILFQQQKKMRLPQQLTYFDGFCGPGKYWKDKDRKELVNGSPLIVGEIANKLISIDNSRRFSIYCIDAKKEHCDYLKDKLEVMNRYRQTWEVEEGKFSDKANEFILQLKERNIESTPIFFFVDPFGYKDIPIDILHRLLKIEMAELFINFMIYDIIRAASNSLMYSNLDELFGCDDYKNVERLSSAEERQIYLKNMYIQQLKERAKARFTSSFRVNTPSQGERHRYYLIHCANHPKALKEMKDAMYRVSDNEFGLEAINIQNDLLSFMDGCDFEADIVSYLKIRVASITYMELEGWCYINTCGVSKNIKSTIMLLEKKKIVSITRLPRQRANTVNGEATIKLIEA